MPIRGRNAQGKSSTLDAIQMALGGDRVAPPRPVRAGEEEGAIRLELDNGTVILRRFTVDGKPTLEVTNGEGFKAGSPQKLLDTLYASVAFDPLAFTRLKPADQLATLRGLVKLDVDVDALNAANQGDYDLRRDKNRELSRESQKLEQMPTHKDVPAAKVDEAALEETIASAAETNGQIERRRVNREQFAEAIGRNKDRVPVRQADIDAAEAQLAEMKREYRELVDLIAARKLVVEADKASTSWLQRQLAIGYNAAVRLIERMEAEGVVSRADATGRRVVLVNVDQRVAEQQRQIQDEFADAVQTAAEQFNATHENVRVEVTRGGMFDD